MLVESITSVASINNNSFFFIKVTWFYELTIHKTLLLLKKAIILVYELNLSMY